MKEIPGYEGLYSITEEGKVFQHPKSWRTGVGVRSIEGGWIGLWKNAKGYMYASLRKDGVRKTIGVHRLVASTYLPNPLNLPQVNHKNTLRGDNHVANLEWCTGKENQEHATGHNLYVVGERHCRAKLTEENVREIRKSSLSTTVLGKRFGVDHSAISAVKRRITWKHVA